MKLLFNKVVYFLKTLQGQIAFYPTLMGLGGFVFSLLMLYMEDKGISAFVFKYAPALVINNADTARTLLSFLTGGIISIMVFSFSMVMVLLSQASSQYSPRVLPDLVSNRRHQYVLGIYLATILYNTFTLIGIDPKPKDSYQLPGFSVLVGIIFSVICFAAFLYFIHSISQSIQINNILDKIYEKAKTRMKELLEKEEEKNIHFPDTRQWQEYYSPHTGYFQKIQEGNLMMLCQKNDLKIKIIPLQGNFVLEGIPIIKVNKKIDDDLKDSIFSYLNFSRGEMVEDNYVLAFKQITEIGVKAMSPGINDPGTAINTIDYLTELFALRIRQKDKTILGDDENVYVFVNTTNFSDLLYQVMVAYRTYCKADMICLQKLFMMLKYLLIQPNINKSHRKALEKETVSLYKDAQDTLKNDTDLEKLERLYKHIPLPETN